MKEYQHLIGRIIIVAAIVIAEAHALEQLDGSIGAGFNTIASQIH